MKKFFCLALSWFGLSSLLLISACSGVKTPEESALEEKSSKQAESVVQSESDTSSNTESEKEAADETEKEIDSSELEEILNEIKKEEEAVRDAVGAKYDGVAAFIGSDYESYKSNYNLITAWYGFIVSECGKFYENSETHCERYYKKALELFNNDDKQLENALEELYRNVNSIEFDNLYSDINALFDKVYDDCGGLLDDADDKIGYEEWDAAWTGFYDDWDAASTLFYKEWDDASTRFYEIWNAIDSGIYEGIREYGVLIAKAKKAAEDNQEDIKTSEEPHPVESTVNNETVFNPQDVSDATIESIKTYGDYLTMYRMIIEDYTTNYENVLKGTPLYNEESFKSIKASYDKGFQEQEDAYGKIKDAPLVGKSDLVDFLKSLRDSLKEDLDSTAETLKSLRY